MNLATHGRFDYSPIRGRPTYEWPNGTRLAFYLAVNVEHFAFGEGLGAELAPGGPAPDVLNFAWREYGNRVGIWRLLDLCDEFKLPAAGLLNATVYDYAPAIAAAFRARDDEIAAHGRTNSERQSSMDEAEERVLIADATEVITRHEGSRPRGWLGPWIAQSRFTLDLLKEAGFEYVLDWCMDDQPIWMRTRSGQILSVPYPQEVNDIPAIAVRRASAAEFADMIVSQFDEMLSQAESGPLVMGVALHPYIVGQPFRLRHLRQALAHIVGQRERIWVTLPGAIARHAAGLQQGIAPRAAPS